MTWKEHQSHRGCFPPEQIDEWWQTQFPEAGIFLMPGAGSGICVVDCDCEPAYHELCRNLNRIPNTPTVKSGNPDPYRMHFIFSIPPNLSTGPKITPWHPQLEFRGERGLVVLPPSVHQSRNRYTWLPGRSIDEVALEPLPDSIVSEWKKYESRQTKNHPVLTSPPIRVRSSQQLNGIISDGHQLPMYSVMNLPGLSRTTKEFLLGVHSNGPGWNDRLFNAACDLVGNRVPIEYATPLLIHGAKPWTDADHQQAMATIESAYTVPRVSGEILAMQYELQRFHCQQKRRK